MEKSKRETTWDLVSQKSPSRYLGKHFIIEFWGARQIEDPEELETFLLKAAEAGNNTPIGTKIYKFNPHGITGIILLAESHISYHSWPENDYIALDIFGCGEKSFPEKALVYLIERLQPEEIKVLEIKRGTRERVIKTLKQIYKTKTKKNL